MPIHSFRFHNNKKFQKLSIFDRKVYLACASIPKGEVRTYGWVAQQINCPGAARAVGVSLSKNPFAPKIPCHRVIRSDGHMGGYSGPGGIAGKIRRLKREGYKFNLTSKFRLK